MDPEVDQDGRPKPVKIYGNPGLTSRIAEFQNRAESHQKKQKLNPFSGSWKKPTLTGPVSGVSNVHLPFDKSDPRYGTPPEGSKTEFRGKKAGTQISKEIHELCYLIKENGVEYNDGSYVITFGELFQIYVTISNKLVGILLRARKHGLLNFEGEILFQRRDEEVPIILFPEVGKDDGETDA